MPEEATSTTAETETSEQTTTGGDEQITMTRAEADALKREVAESRKAARKAKSDVEKFAEDKAKADGDFKAAAEAAEKRATDAEQRASQVERSARVAAAAGRLKFRDPGDVMHRLTEAALDDDALLERELKQIKKDSPYLATTEPRRSGGSIEGDATPAKDMDALIRQAAGRPS